MKQHILNILVLGAFAFHFSCEPKDVVSLPTADFTIIQNGCELGCTVTFTNRSQNATFYTWDFGDGNTSTEVSPTKQYAAAKTYIVKLTAKNEAASNTTQQTVTISSPPTAVWDKSFGGSGLNFLRSVVVTLDGSFILGGYSSSRPSGNKNAVNFGSHDFWLIKINASGDKVWEKTFGGSNSDEFFYITATQDGGYLLGGNSASNISGNKTAPNHGGRDFWLIKINADGDKLWDKTYGGSNDDVLRYIVATQDGSFLLGGNSSSLVSSNKSAPNYAASDYWLVKVNSNGDKIWDKSFGGSDVEKLSTIVTTQDGGFLLCGISSSIPSGNKVASHYGAIDYWVVKINNSGEKVWDKSFGGNYNDILNAAVPTQDGGFLLGGTSNVNNTISTNWVDAVYDSWVVKINANGDKVWEKSYGGNSYDDISTLIATQDGGFLLGGKSFSPISGSKTAPNYASSSDYWIVKIGANGDKYWDKTFGGNGFEDLIDITTTHDGGFLLGGDSSSPTSDNKSASNFGIYDFWVIKIK